MSDFLNKLRSKRTVLTRTQKRPQLPETVIYIEWLAGAAQRRVVDTEGRVARFNRRYGHATPGTRGKRK